MITVPTQLWIFLLLLKVTTLVIILESHICGKHISTPMWLQWQWSHYGA